MLHVLNADATCAKCGETICRGTVVSWIAASERVTRSGPHHIDCSPSKADRDQAQAEAAAGFSRLDLQSPGRPQATPVNRPVDTPAQRKIELPKLSYQFTLELEKKDRTLTVSLVSVSCAILAISITTDGLPYDYYTALRFAVSGTGAFLARQLWECPERYWRVIFVGVALLYNPLVPVHLSKDIWEPLNILTVPLLVVGQHIKHFYGKQAKSEA